MTIADQPLAERSISHTRTEPRQVPHYGKSPIAKRSVVLNGHKTSISLEDAFWAALRKIAALRRQSVAALVAEIDRRRTDANLSSAIRLFVLEHYQQQARAG